ncbi:MAG TPA: DUF1549 domain-containing protein [Pirellulales bacterium]|jgi:hypothetical protein|nr:DUF1549 domain-containing protein [Pirellulales bacterium]
MVSTQGFFASRSRLSGRLGLPARLLLLCVLAAASSTSLYGEEESSRANFRGAASLTDTINKRLHEEWELAKVSASPAASDGEWCRRVYLDLIGRIPSVDELERYLAESARNRKSALVGRLLGSQYSAEYARNWSTLWTNLLIGRSGGTQRNSLINRDGLRQALSEALERNLPYDQLALAVLSAKGVSKPGEPGFNGFVNFLAGSLQENAVQATAKTAQVFLGLQIQCTQCHNHPFNEWKQNQFWELNAFFRQTRALRRFDADGGRQVASIELIDQDFAGENNKPEEAAVFYELRNGLTKVAYPTFVDGTALPSASGFVSDVERRGELARLVVHSDYLAPALVSRMWAHFFGYGFTKPVDDMGPHNPPHHAELLAELATGFRDSGFDQKELIRAIVLCDAYGLSSKPGLRNKKDDPLLGDAPQFSRFYLRQMRAEELYESLLVATTADRISDSAEQESVRRRWLDQFTVAFGTDDQGEATTFNGTIPQTLMMMNGELMKRATSAAAGGFLHTLAHDARLNNAARLNRLYLAALARRPTGQEINLANELMLARKGDPVAALQDVWWALLNSNEFILNH